MVPKYHALKLVSKIEPVLTVPKSIVTTVFISEETFAPTVLPKLLQAIYTIILRCCLVFN
jgi:hypothetical protein